VKELEKKTEKNEGGDEQEGQEYDEDESGEETRKEVEKLKA
jgi:hypothetical protein